jgi:hypothetical protein
LGYGEPVIALESSTTTDPNLNSKILSIAQQFGSNIIYPIYTGGGPSARNLARSSAGL